jgi:surface polysaccharide O-acyltransferase-like enzyme
MIDYEHLPAAFAEWLSIDCYDVVVVLNQRMTSMTSHYVQCRAVHRDGECLGARAYLLLVLVLVLVLVLILILNRFNLSYR